MSALREYWRGAGQAWECDELGHLNVRFYLAKAMNALGGFAEAAGMGGAFTPSATATLILREAHLRYHAEVLPGRPLVIHGAVDAFSDSELTLALVMTDAASGAVHAAQRLTLVHADPKTGRAFPFARRTSAALDALSAPTPEPARPRGLAQTPGALDCTATRADALGLETTGRSRIGPDDVDVFGRLRADLTIGKISDTVVNFSAGLVEQWDAAARGEPLSIASAVLEARMRVRRLPCVGSGFVLRSGLADVSAKTRRAVHWALDSASGEALWTMDAVVCMMDLGTRTLATPDPATLERLQGLVIKDLRG